MITPSIATKFVGIVNATPDSFSDGGRFTTIDAIKKRIEELAQAGTDIIDLGVESTRPGATALTPQQEWDRLQPIIGDISKCCQSLQLELSIDSRHKENSIKALDFGSTWVNDVSASYDDKLIDSIKHYNANYVLMHNLGVPACKQTTLSEHQDPITTLIDWATPHIAKLQSMGLDANHIIFDPGIGFGKTPQQSAQIVKQAAAFKSLNVATYIGHSRKSFITNTPHPQYHKDLETLAISRYLIEQNIDYLRVHDMETHHRFFTTYFQYSEEPF